MKSLILRLKNNNALKKVLYVGILVFLFLYSFSIPAFSGRPVWYIISYFLMAVLAGCTVIYTFLYTKFKINKWIIVPALFVAYAFLGTAFYSHSFVGSSGRIGWTTLVLMLITLIIFYYAFVTIENKRLIFTILMSAFGLFALYFAFVYRDPILHLQLSSARLGSYFDNVNTIGFYFAIGSTLSLYLALFYKKKFELLYLIPSFVFAGLGLFTGSRAFIIAVAAAAITILFLKFKNHKIIFFIVLASLIGLFFVLINVPQLAFLKDQFDRTLYTLFGIGNSKVETSTVQRFIWPQYAFYLAGKNMLFGFGVNGFAIYSGVGAYAHNNFGEVLCNFGIIGFILYYLCFFVPLVLGFKQKDKEIYMVPVLVAIYFFRGFFGVTYYAKEAYLLIALCLFLTKDCTLPTFKLKRLAHINVEYYEVNI